MIAETHIWRTDDGRLVPDGDPDAAFLAYPKGRNIPDKIAEEAGLKAKAKPQDKARAKGEDKVTDGPNNPRRIWPSRTTGSPEHDEQPEPDEEALRAEAEQLGLNVSPKAKPETIARRIAEAKAEAEAED